MRNFRENLKIMNYDEAYDAPQVICLGFFDCVHLGHMKLFNKARLISYMNNFETSFFTFDNNPLRLFSNQKLIYTFDERIEVFNDLGVDNVFKATFSKEFANISRKEFLDKLTQNKNIKAIVCGNDYTFGANKEGNVEFLKNYCDSANIDLYVEDLYLFKNEKLASKSIRQYIIDGNISEINKVLVTPYTISGIVEKGRGVGKEETYPTANIKLSEDKEVLKSGVYYTRVVIDGVRFRAVTNVGDKPTFNVTDQNIETYILFYNKSLYGKKIKVEFVSRLRDIYKFDTANELKEQITKDINYVCSENGEIHD